jgi:hypothetical protein
MTCNRYWREGIVVVERGLDDPHRDGCEDCSRAHASRQELIEALPLVGASQAGDPHWQAKVWRRIDGERAQEQARPAWRWRWQLSGALVAVCAVALWFGIGRSREGVVRSTPTYEVAQGPVAMRSGHSRDVCGPDGARGASVGDHLLVKVGKASTVWIYREEGLVLQCRAHQESDSCKRDPDGMSVELVLSRSGAYHVLVVEDPVAAEPRGELDRDRARLEAVNARYDECQLSAR